MALGVDKAGNLLVRVSGDGALALLHPDRTETNLNQPYVDGSRWYTESGNLMPNGRVVGQVFDADGTKGPRGFVWDPGDDAYQLLRQGDWPRAYAYDGNRSGVLIGRSDQQALIWESKDGKPKPLPGLDGYPATRAFSIDRHGRVYGIASTAGSLLDPAYRRVYVSWADGKVSRLSFPDRFKALAIEKGLAAGYVVRKSGLRRPAYYGSEGLVVPDFPRNVSGLATTVASNGLFAGHLIDTSSNRIVGSFVGASDGALHYPTQSGVVAQLRSFNGGTLLLDGDDDETILSCLAAL